MTSCWLGVWIFSDQTWDWLVSWLRFTKNITRESFKTFTAWSNETGCFLCYSSSLHKLQQTETGIPWHCNDIIQMNDLEGGFESTPVKHCQNLPKKAKQKTVWHDPWLEIVMPLPIIQKKSKKQLQKLWDQSLFVTRRTIVSSITWRHAHNLSVCL